MRALMVLLALTGCGTPVAPVLPSPTVEVEAPSAPMAMSDSASAAPVTVATENVPTKAIAVARPALVPVGGTAPTSTTPAPAPAPATTTPAATTSAAAPAVSAGPKTWTIDTAHSSLYVLVRIDKTVGFSSFGHDHAIVASNWSGSVTWDAADASKCKVTVTVPVSGLLVDPGDIRAKVGMPDETSESDKTKISENFQGEGQLDMQNHPNLTFTSTSCSGTSGKVNVVGNFSMKAQTHPVTIALNVDPVDSGTFHAAGGFSLNGSAWGMPPFAAPFGVLKNQDGLNFVMDIRGK